MGKLRASVDGCEVEVTFDSPDDLTEELRDALASVAEAMVAQGQHDSDEVVGFGRLKIGDLRSSPIIGGTTLGFGCWGYDRGPVGGGSCTWYSLGDDGEEPASCTVYTK